MKKFINKTSWFGVILFAIAFIAALFSNLLLTPDQEVELFSSIGSYMAWLVMASIVIGIFDVVVFWYLRIIPYSKMQTDEKIILVTLHILSLPIAGYYVWARYMRKKTEFAQ